MSSPPEDNDAAPEVPADAAEREGQVEGEVVDLDRARELRATPADPEPLPAGGGATVLVDVAVDAPSRGLADRVRSVERQPIVAGWARSRDEVRLVARWAAGNLVHTAGFHAVRVPLYAGRLALRAPQGAAHGVTRALRWASDAEGAPARRAAVAASDTQQYLRLSAQRDSRVQGRSLLVIAAALAGLWVFFATAPAARWALILAALALAGAVGSPADEPLFTPAVVIARYGRLTGNVVLRAFEAAGLCRPPNDPITFPSQIARDGEGFRAVVDLPYGRTFREAMGKRDSIASGLDVAEQQVFLTRAKESTRRVVLWVADVDPLSESPGRTPLLRMRQVDFWEPVPWGLNERGGVVSVSMLWTSLLVGAVPRQGKTFSARTIALAAALDPHVRLYVYDGSGKPDWRGFAAVAHRCGFGLRLGRDGVDPAAVLLADLRELKAEAEARYERLGELPTSLVPEGKLTKDLSRNLSMNMPLTLVILEEIQEYLTHPEHGKAILEVATYLVKVSPAVGISVLSSTQKPDSTQVPTIFRDQHQARFCLRVTSWQVSDVILGSGAYSEGLDASRLLPSHKGVGILRGMTDVGETVRTYLADQDDADTILARARILREQAGTLSGAAIGDTPAAATVMAASLLDDLAAVVPPGEAKVWSEVVVTRLAELRPAVYGAWGPDQLAVALKPHGIATAQIGRRIDGQVVNRRGIDRADIATAITARSARPDSG